MPKRTDEFYVPLPSDRTAELVRTLLSSDHWKIEESSNTRITCKERTGIAMHNPLKLTIDVVPSDSNATRVLVNGSVFGVGPLQTNHLKKGMEEFRQVVEIAGKELAGQIRAGMLCPTCGSFLAPGTRFCPKDGTPVARACEHCGHSNMPGAQFCSQCGKPMA